MSRRRSPRHLTPLVLTATLVAVAVASATPPTPSAAPAHSDHPATAARQPADPDAGVDPELLSTLRYRSIGPLRGGRSTAVTGVTGRTRTFFMGSTGGGVWRTGDAGVSWENVSDGFFDVASVGAVDVADADPNVIYVGTGSACIRGNATTGKGVYRSRDGGDTWEHVGLGETGTIGRIAIHPRDPELVYVAALGHPFGPNEERGVYRSRDGGDTWERVLHVNAEVGAVDLSMNPRNPREIYAAMWRFERKPWTFHDASADGGIFKTTDGGDTWAKLRGGLPEGVTGRIGVSVSPADPDRVYALVSAADPHGGLYRSDDRGDTWQRVNRDRNLRQRHWYYSHVRADPVDPNTVYVLNVSLWRSVDAGESVERLRPGHGDTHDLWIDPTDPDVMILGDDGGAEVSTNGGDTWSSLYNQPTAEIYRVSVDERFPYRVYGAQQDNTTLSLRSDGDGDRQDWYSVGGCESGHIAVDPRDPDIVYAGCYIGEITRYDHSTGERKPISVYPVLVDGVAPRELEHRFQWNAPILVSRHDPNVLYHASNTVNRSRDEGMTWEVISPDLTRDDPEKQELPGGPLQHDHTSVEVFGTVFALAESPHDPDELWAGSDDGLVHVSRDGGDTWKDVTPAGLPEDGTVNTIEVSPHRPGRVTVAVHRYRLDDWAPYAFRTEDWGDSWELLTGGDDGIPADHPVRTVREDPDREGLLYAGTEFGMYVSFDDGDRWQPLQLNLPVTPVTELVVHRQELVVATQGRGLWILDDLTPLHGLTPELAASDLWLLQPRPAIRASGTGSRPAVLHYSVPADADAELEIVDADGAAVRSWATDGEGDDLLPTDDGPARLTWDLRHPAPDLTDDALIYLGYSGGPMALPGTYRARLSVGDRTVEEPLVVQPDPRRDDVRPEDLRANFELSVRTRDLLQRTHDDIARLRAVRGQARDLLERVVAADAEPGRLRELVDDVDDRLTAIEEVMIQTKAEARQDPINFPPMLDTQIGYLYRYVVSTYGRPPQAAYERYAELETALQAEEASLREVLEGPVAALAEAVAERGLGGILVPRR